MIELRVGKTWFALADMRDQGNGLLKHIYHSNLAIEAMVLNCHLLLNYHK